MEREAPHFTSPVDRYLARHRHPVPVSCCWNGAVVVRGEALTHERPPPISQSPMPQQQEVIEEGGLTGNRNHVRFRRPEAVAGLGIAPADAGACDESECTTFCRDLWTRGSSRIFVNPAVVSE